MPRVVEIPVPSFDAVAVFHLSEQRGARVWRQDVKSRRCDSAFDCPVHRAGKDVAIVASRAENEAAIDHDPEGIQPADNLAIAASEVLTLAGAYETVTRERFESHEQASQTDSSSPFDQVVTQDRINCGGSLKNAAHAFHSTEQLAREPGIPKKMIIQKVQVLARQA